MRSKLRRIAGEPRWLAGVLLAGIFLAAGCVTDEPASGTPSPSTVLSSTALAGGLFETPGGLPESAPGSGATEAQLVQAVISKVANDAEVLTDQVHFDEASWRIYPVSRVRVLAVDVVIDLPMLSIQRQLIDATGNFLDEEELEVAEMVAVEQRYGYRPKLDPYLLQAIEGSSDITDRFDVLVAVEWPDEVQQQILERTGDPEYTSEDFVPLMEELTPIALEEITGFMRRELGLRPTAAETEPLLEVTMNRAQIESIAFRDDVTRISPTADWRWQAWIPGSAVTSG